MQQLSAGPGDRPDPADRAGLDPMTCEINRDGGGLFCCSEFCAQFEDPEVPEEDGTKRFFLDNGRVYDTAYKHGTARICFCPYCGAEIRVRPERGR